MDLDHRQATAGRRYCETVRTGQHSYLDILNELMLPVRGLESERHGMKWCAFASIISISSFRSLHVECLKEAP
jgi:hypothetical protein